MSPDEDTFYPRTYIHGLHNIQHVVRGAGVTLHPPSVCLVHVTICCMVESMRAFRLSHCRYHVTEEKPLSTHFLSLSQALLARLDEKSY